MMTAWVWFCGTVSYLVLAGQSSLDEIAVGVALGGLGAAWRAAVLRGDARRFAFEREALGVVGAALRGFPAATLDVGRRLAEGLIRGVPGHRVERPFDHGRPHDPRDAGRRAIVVLAASLAPDSYALHLPPDGGTITIHTLTGAAPNAGPRWPS